MSRENRFTKRNTGRQCPPKVPGRGYYAIPALAMEDDSSSANKAINYFLILYMSVVQLKIASLQRNTA